MLTGALIAESVRIGTTLEGVGLVLRRMWRGEVSNVAANQPDTWTIIEFGADSELAEELAETLAGVLDGPGWYASFEVDDGRVFVVFPGQVFQYVRSDQVAHAETIAYALAAGVPETQCDW
jgi:hypothetical protein